VKFWSAVVAAGVLLAGCGNASPPTAEQRERARAAGYDVALAYVTDVEGYQRADQSAGPYGDAGFAVAYADDRGEQLWLVVEHRGLTADTCPALPIPYAQPPTAPVTCTRDGDGWRRASGGRVEYALARGDLLVRVAGPAATAGDVVRAAATDARPARSRELDDLLAAAPDAPVERGDLPPNGDGAPVDPTGPGG
jgi:hypothetical protein